MGMRIMKRKRKKRKMILLKKMMILIMKKKRRRMILLNWPLRLKLVNGRQQQLQLQHPLIVPLMRKVMI